MIFDENSLGKTVEAISTETLTAAANGTNVAATATAVDAKGYKSCVIGLHFTGEDGDTLGNCTADTGIPIAITVSDNGTNYSAIDVGDVLTYDGTYDATTKALTVAAGDITAGKLTARIGIIAKHRYIKITASNVGKTSGPKTLTVTALAELGRPVYSRDFFAQDAKPSQA